MSNQQESAVARPEGRASSAALAVFLLAASAVLYVACGEERTSAPPEHPSAPARSAASYVGSARCAACHPQQHGPWKDTDHAHAMQPATAEHVRGDFANAAFHAAGVTTRFQQRDGKFYVATDDASGAVREFEIAHTFGRDPLQQYLIAFPRGVVQALGIAWDTRAKEQGGQRWYHLYADAPPPAGDPLHWTGREQRWNHQCAECHATDLEKRYDRAREAYDTRYHELGVGCEACHGAGSAHVAWAEGDAAQRASDPRRGFARSLGAPRGAWVMRDEARGIAEWQGEPRGEAELETCARCHARRGPLVEHSQPEERFLDAYRPALLDEGLYHADGQILDEVFEWGSCVQSKMHAQGVRCSDCHDSHSSGLKAPGNAVCAQCHLPAKFDTPKHHGHASGTPGSACVDCHMPMRTYMGVDGRRDHSFRVPRPDLTLELGTPNACASCHEQRGAKWAHDAIRGWRAAPREELPHFAQALSAGRRGALDAEERLLRLAADAAQPGIARATAWNLLPPLAGPRTLRALDAALRDGEPLVRAAALGALAELEPLPPSPAVLAALADPLRLVRIAAARALAGLDRSRLSAEEQQRYARAFGEARAAELALAERPQSWINLGNLELRAGNAAEAERCFAQARALDPRFVPAWVNLADMQRLRGDEAGARASLERANADVAHALGLLFTRTGERERGRAELRRAHELAPRNTRYAYVHAVALHDAGARDEALAVLERAQRERPADRDVLEALAAYEEERGNAAAVQRWREALARLQNDGGR
jgi:Tfp pilus assembly protein PilF